jgi:stearoyl-CoA desaturase (delta-9 desaturase)
MAPNLTGSATGLFLAETEVISSPVQPQTARRPSKPDTKAPRYVWRIVWRNVLAFIYLHTVSLFGLYQMVTVAKWYTIMWGKFTFPGLHFLSRINQRKNKRNGFL